MHSNEWPLIGFTLAVQGAVGMVLILAVTYAQIADRVSEGRAEDLAAVVLVVVLALLAVSGAVVTLHLGNLRNVYLVLANWRSSWLSREVLLVGVFTATVALYAMMYLTGAGRGAMRGLFGVVVSVVGLTLIATIAKLYMLRTVPVWNRSATPLTFFASTLVFGLTGIALAIALLDSDRTEGIQQILGALTLVVLAAQLAIFERHRSRLRTEDEAAAVSGMLLNKTFTKQVRSRIALAAGGALALIPTALDWFPRPAGLAIVALLVVASEIVGRHLFYASYARSGL